MSARLTGTLVLSKALWWSGFINQLEVYTDLKRVGLMNRILEDVLNRYGVNATTVIVLDLILKPKHEVSSLLSARGRVFKGSLNLVLLT